MDSGRLMISSAAAPFCSAVAGGSQVLQFGGGFRGGTSMVAAVAENGRRKRPFFTPHEALQLELGLDIMDDVDQLCGFEYELQGAPERTKRRLTAEQVQALEVSFEEEKRKLEPERKGELARRLGIAPRQVAVWFQNRRARWRTKQLEQDFDRLRAAHDELLAGRDALVADNDRLLSQVIRLTEKLQAKEPPATQAEEQSAPNPSGPADNTAMQAAAPSSAGSYFAAGAPLPPSSSEGDCGGDEGSALFLPADAMLLAAVEQGRGLGAEEDSWEWFWNSESPSLSECVLV